MKCGPDSLPYVSTLNMKLIVCLYAYTGGRDKRGGPILTFPARSNHDRIKQEDLRRLVTYLSTVPRYTHYHHRHHVYSLFNHHIYSHYLLWVFTLLFRTVAQWRGAGWSARGVFQRFPACRIKRSFLLHRSSRLRAAFDLHQHESCSVCSRQQRVCHTSLELYLFLLPLITVWGCYRGWEKTDQ